jgi:hypothetical protein
MVKHTFGKRGPVYTKHSNALLSGGERESYNALANIWPILPTSPKPRVKPLLIPMMGIIAVTTIEAYVKTPLVRAVKSTLNIAVSSLTD